MTRKILQLVVLLTIILLNGVAQEVQYKNRQDFYIHSEKSDRENHLYFYDDNKKFVRMEENGRLSLWSVNEGLPINIFEKLGYLGHISNSADNRYILIHSVLDYIDSIKLLDTKKRTLTTLESKEQIEGSSYHTDISQDGKYIIITEGDCSQRGIKVWDIEKSKFISKFPTHTKEGILSIKIVPSNSFIVSFSRENSIDTWSIEGKHLKHIQLTRNRYYRGELTISSDEKSILMGGNVIDIEQEKVIKVLPKRENGYNEYLFNPLDSDEIIHLVKGDKNLIELLDWKNDKNIEIVDNNLSYYEYKFSSNRESLFVLDKNRLYIFDLKSKKVIQKIEDIDDAFQTTSDNRNLLYFNKNGELILIDIESKKIINKINTGKKLKSVTQAVLSGNKKYLAINLGDGNVSIWDINRSKPISIFIENKEGLNRLITLDSSGEHLISVDNSDIRIWNLSKGEILQTYKIENIHNIYPDDLFLTPNNRYLILFSDERTEVWDMEKHQFISTKFKVNQRKLFYVDKYLVSIFEEEQVLLYDSKNLETPIREFTVARDNSWLVIDNEHHTLYQGGEGIPLLKSKKMNSKDAFSLSSFIYNFGGDN